MIPANSIYAVLADYVWILNIVFLICYGLDMSLYLWFKNKKSSIFVHPKNVWFLQKISGSNQKKWKYGPFIGYIAFFLIACDSFNFRYYFSDNYTILIVLLVIHSIVFIKEWMWEKKEEKGDNTPSVSKGEKDIKPTHK